MENQLEGRGVKRVRLSAGRRWLHALALAGLFSVISGCADTVSGPTHLSPPGARKAAGGQCVDELNPCPDPPPPSTLSGGGASGFGAQVDPSDASAGIWPQSLFVVYTSPYDGSTMSGWASFAYSGILYATYAFSTDSFSTGSKEVGGFTMDASDLLVLEIEGQFTTYSWHISGHSAAGQ
jgi:hypothetical protein